MRRFSLLILTALILLSCCGCSQKEETEFFFYLRSDYLPGISDGVIAPEERTVNEDRGLNYSLRLYLEGPVDEQYISPFPEGLRLLSTKFEGGRLQIYLSSEFAALKDIDLTLACACFANTCFALTDAQEIQIIASTPEGNHVYDIDPQSFTLLDDAMGSNTTE